MIDAFICSPLQGQYDLIYVQLKTGAWLAEDPVPTPGEIRDLGKPKDREEKEDRVLVRMSRPKSAGTGATSLTSESCFNVALSLTLISLIRQIEPYPGVDKHSRLSGGDHSRRPSREFGREADVGMLCTECYNLK